LVSYRSRSVEDTDPVTCNCVCDWKCHGDWCTGSYTIVLSVRTVRAHLLRIAQLQLVSVWNRDVAKKSLRTHGRIETREQLQSRA
jgi:hypothetical protein